MDQAFSFGRERDLDTALEIIQRYRDFSVVPVPVSGGTTKTIFAKVDTGQSGKSVTATEVVWNANTTDWEAPSGTPIKFNDANVSSDDYTLPSLQSSTDLSADDVVEVIVYPDKSGNYDYFARPSGGGSDIVYIEITASTNINTYTGTIYDNPVDRNSIQTGVTVKAMQHDAGTIPNSSAGEGFFCYKNGDNYYILNYPVFLG